MRDRAVLLIYGEGGHRAQMKILYAQLAAGLISRGLVPVGICENQDSLAGFKSYSQGGLRDKHSLSRSLISTPHSIIQSIFIIIRLMWRYRVECVISTGPGIAVLPSIAFKLTGAKVIFIESWSRFETTSATGRLVYHFADQFYIQNRGLKKKYPSAFYGGLL